MVSVMSTVLAMIYGTVRVEYVGTVLHGLSAMSEAKPGASCLGGTAVLRDVLANILTVEPGALSLGRIVVPRNVFPEI